MKNPKHTIKVLARVDAHGVVEVKSLIHHPMDSGFQFDEEFNPIPAHFIEVLTFKHKGRVVMRTDWGPAVSKDPFVSFRFRGGHKGDPIEVHWADNEGESDSLTAHVE